MRRVRAPSHSGAEHGLELREELAEPPYMRRMFAQTVLTRVKGDSYASGCVRCPDVPCVRFRHDEISEPFNIEAPYAPERAVCPTDALRAGSDGVPVVDVDACVGCGLCVARCPVGAISLAPGTCEAVVAEPDHEHYVESAGDVEAFAIAREGWDSLLRRERPPWSDAGRVSDQLARIESKLTRLTAPRSVRLLARNAFLVSGAGARLQNPGDHNAWAELAVETQSWVLPLEIESGSDSLDALRRSLAGAAVVISRLGGDRAKTRPGIVLIRLPNARVDFYRVLADAHERLELVCLAIPIASLLLMIRAFGEGLEPTLSASALGTTRPESLREALSSLYGELPGGAETGLAAPK